MRTYRKTLPLETWKFTYVPANGNVFKPELFDVRVCRKPSSTAIWREMLRHLESGKFERISYTKQW